MRAVVCLLMERTLILAAAHTCRHQYHKTLKFYKPVTIGAHSSLEFDTPHPFTKDDISFLWEVDSFDGALDNFNHIRYL